MTEHRTSKEQFPSLEAFMTHVSNRWETWRASTEKTPMAVSPAHAMEWIERAYVAGHERGDAEARAALEPPASEIEAEIIEQLGQRNAAGAEMTKEQVYELLCRYYVQRADERQREMGLSYTTAETHDLAGFICGIIESHSEMLTKARRADEPRNVDPLGAETRAATSGGARSTEDAGRPQPPAGWRPIETAPKDGTLVLCVVAGWEPGIYKWHESEDGGGRWTPDPENFLREEDFRDWLNECAYEPTHWMPLPPAPTKIPGTQS